MEGGGVKNYRILRDVIYVRPLCGNKEYIRLTQLLTDAINL